jgi:hypothetical protein
MTTKEIEKDITHMDIKATDYAEPLLNLSRGSKKIHELFQKRNPLQAVYTIDYMICELILLKNWAKLQAKTANEIY